jgi:ketosteroid isomerase-like protein
MLGKAEVDLVRRGYDAFIAGDMEWLNQHLDENIVWHVAGGGSLSGDVRGREEVLAYFAKSVQVAVPEIEIHDLAAGDDHVVGVLNVTWRRPTGETFSSRAVQVFHVDGDRALESWFVPEDQAGVDAFLDAAG